MSEISVLSSQYDKLVATSDKVNNSVVAFKKRSLLSDARNRTKYPKLTVSDEELRNASVILDLFLTNVQRLLVEDLTESDFIPAIVLDDYKKRISEDPYIKEELNKLLTLLKKGQPFTESELTVMDSILSILDSERNMLFRKLRTARG
jgi:hypothetical protein